jgi:hypothetical protein
MATAIHLFDSNSAGDQLLVAFLTTCRVLVTVPATLQINCSNELDTFAAVVAAAPLTLMITLTMAFFTFSNAFEMSVLLVVGMAVPHANVAFKNYVIDSNIITN